MQVQRLLCCVPLFLAASCAAPAPAERVTPAPHAGHACQPPAAAAQATPLPVAKASVNGRPEVRYYVIGDA
jgi:hypothetical protein